MYRPEDERRYGVPKLNNANYFTWKQKVEMILIKEELWDVLELPTPDNPDDSWTRKNKLAMATIGLLISDKHLVDIKHEVTAIGIWRKLERTHQRDSLGTRLMLYRKLFTAKYTVGENMEDHLSDILITAEQLQDRGYPVPPEILCASLLGSLPREYNPMITAVEGRNAEEITTEYVRSKILEEAVRQKHSATHTTMALNTEERNGYRRRTESRQCYYCKKIGHIRSDCRLLKRPEAHKPMQGQRTNKNNPRRNNNNKQHVKITTEEEQDSPTQSRERNTVNLTQTIPTQRALTVNGPNKPNLNKQWILDTGAGSHMCNNIDMLKQIKKLDKNISIVTASGQQHIVTLKGECEIHLTTEKGKRTNLLLKDVLHVPQLTDNLISISKLDQEGLEIFFKDKRCWIIYNSEKYKMGDLKDNLYILEEEKIALQVNLCKHVWHRRMGHRDTNYITKTQRTTQPEGLHITECQSDQLCEVCQITKKHQNKFGLIKNRKPDQVFHTIHADLCGPITPQSLGGNRFILSIIDDFSRFTKVYLLAHKNQATKFIVQYIEEGVNKFNRRPIILRTDGGGEFENHNLNDYLHKNGIKHHLSLPYLHQQNGLIERYNRTLLEGVRALLKEARLPDNMWGEMASTSTYLNNLIIKSEQIETPYQLWHNQAPSYEHIRTIGSKCYFMDNTPNKNKLQDRGMAGVLLGYGSSTSFYRILNLSTNKIQECRGVTFEDEICPYQLTHARAQHPSPDREDTHHIDTEQVKNQTPVETRKSSRNNFGKPPQTLTYSQDGESQDTQKDWHTDHNIQQQSRHCQCKTLGE